MRYVRLFKRWALHRAELHLEDLRYEDTKWVSGWPNGCPPSQIGAMQRRIARAEKRVARLRSER